MWYIIIPLLIVSLVYFGPKQTINNAIFLVFSIFAFRIFWAFLPFLLILYVGRLLLAPKRPQQNRRTYYYRFNGQDFDNFFRQGAGSQGRSYSSGGAQGGFAGNPYFEDKSKYYSSLGLAKGATQEEIKKAFRSKAREYHPDKFANAPESQKQSAELKFKEINEAYEKLKA